MAGANAAATSPEQRVQAIRSFNRFYTGRIGPYLRGGFSLTEVRVLYELAHRERPAAGELCRDLGVGPGYLSRILGRFIQDGLVDREPSARDKRTRRLALTKKGRATFAGLDARSGTAPGGGQAVRLGERTYSRP